MNNNLKIICQNLCKKLVESEETISKKNDKDKETSLESNPDKLDENKIEANNEAKKESSNKSIDTPVVEEKKPIEEKSESSASEADKTKDESKV